MSKLFEVLKETARREMKVTVEIYVSGNFHVFAGEQDLISTRDEAELIAKLSKRLVKSEVPELMNG